MVEQNFLIFEDKDFKVFEFEANVFFLDDENYLKTGMGFSDCEVDIKNPYPVKNDSGKIIGSVNLSLQSHVLVGNFFIDFQTPERLNIEAKEVNLYPHLNFTYEASQVGRAVKANSIKIEGVMLSINPNRDIRVENVKS